MCASIIWCCRRRCEKRDTDDDVFRRCEREKPKLLEIPGNLIDRTIGATPTCSHLSRISFRIRKKTPQGARWWVREAVCVSAPGIPYGERHFLQQRGAKKLPFHLCVRSRLLRGGPRAHPRRGERIPRIPMIIQLLPVIRAINARVVCWHTHRCVPHSREQETTNESALTPFISSDLLMAALSGAEVIAQYTDFYFWHGRTGARRN